MWNDLSRDILEPISLLIKYPQKELQRFMSIWKE